jgi:hypothetical protein
MMVGFERPRWTRKLARATAIAVVASGLGAGVANALSEWWTPDGMRCPIFDTADACQSYCASDASRCGGSSQCSFTTGPTRPMCAPSSKKPDSDTASDGWQGPAAH